MENKMEGLASLLQGLSEHEIDAAVQLLQNLQTRRKADGQADTSAVAVRPDEAEVEGVSAQAAVAQAVSSDAAAVDEASRATPAAPTITFDSQAVVVSRSGEAAPAPATQPGSATASPRSEAATASDKDELPLSALYAVDARDGDEAVVVSTAELSAESASATPQSVYASQPRRRRRRVRKTAAAQEQEQTAATTTTPGAEPATSHATTTAGNEAEDRAGASEGHTTTTTTTTAPPQKGSAARRNGTTTGHKSAAPLTMHSLTSFGFQSCPVVSNAAEQNRLFPPFVQDRRVVPAALQFWNQRPDDKAGGEAKGTSDATRGDAALRSAAAVPCISVEDEVSVVAEGLPRGESAAHRLDVPAAASPLLQRLPYCDAEESSLMHPPLCVVEDSVSASVSIARAGTFGELIQASNTADTPAAREELCEKMHYAVCSLHTTLPAPYAGFDREVVFCGFFAIGYDPFQARPPYFGTYNHLQEGNLSAAELQHMARFPAGGAMPRLSALDYDYDSGDDWDVLENDDGIALSGSESGESDAAASASLSSSELDFINDENDENDSDCELQRKMMEARERRLARLRGKDRLVPSFSGPFVGLSSSEHPLSAYDRLERLAPLDDAYFTAMLDTELAAMGMATSGEAATNSKSAAAAAAPSQHAGTHAADEEESEAQREQRLMEAALKGRRDMTEEEVRVMHELIATSNRISTKVLIEVLRQRHLCIGVPRAEVERTVRRYYERKHGFLLRRPQPWEVTDERLFARLMKREGNGGLAACATASATLTDYIASHTHHDTADEREANEEAEVQVVAAAKETPARDSATAVDEEGSTSPHTGAPPAVVTVVAAEEDDDAVARKRPRSEADEVVCCEPNSEVVIVAAAEQTSGALPLATTTHDELGGRE